MADARPHSDPRVYGDLEVLSLFDVCQFLMIAGKTGTLAIEDGARRATLTLVHGQIVDGVDDSMRDGEETVLRVLAWSRGRWGFIPGGEDLLPSIPIGASTGALLLEAARRMDESPAAALAARSALRAGAAGPHAVAFLQKQRFAEEFAALYSSLETAADPGFDFRQEISVEALIERVAQRGGTRLYLEVGVPPRMRGPDGLVLLGSTAVPQRALDQVVAAFVTAADKLDPSGAAAGVTRERMIENVGPVRFEMAYDGEAKRLSLTLMDRHAPGLRSFGIPEPDLLPIARARNGLLLVGAPPQGGKSALVASLIATAVSAEGRHVAHFEESPRYRLDAGPSIVEALQLPTGEASREVIAAQVWRRKVDVVAIDSARCEAHAVAALGAAGGGALTIVAVEAAAAVDAVVRLLTLIREHDRPAAAARLAATLLAVLVVCPHRAETMMPGEPLQWEHELLVPDRVVREAIRRSNFAALAARLSGAGRAAAPPAAA